MELASLPSSTKDITRGTTFIARAASQSLESCGQSSYLVVPKTGVEDRAEDAESGNGFFGTCLARLKAYHHRCLDRILPRRLHRYTRGWRGTLTAASFVTIIIIMANISLLVWAMQQPVRESNRVLFEGNCKKAKSIDTWLHLVINLMSTIVLGASNFSMQIVTAPTRQSIDMAHASKKYLDIGILSSRNLYAAPLKQKLLWILLAIGSLPLHLFWNSVIISTDQAFDYESIVVSQDYLDGKTAMLQIDNDLIHVGGHIDQLQQQLASMQRLTTSECISALTPLLVSNVANFVLISNISSGHGNFSSLLDTFTYNSQRPGIAAGWQCGNRSSVYEAFYRKHDNPEYGTNNALELDCRLHRPDPDNWVVSTLYSTTSPGQLTPIKIEYCLIDEVLESCTVELLPTLHYIVLFCNFLKLTAFIAVLTLKTEPLLVLGDAIASFLDNPVPQIPSRTLVSMRTVRADIRGRRNTALPRFYFNSSSAWRICLAFVVMLFVWGLATILFFVSQYRNEVQVPLAFAWSMGITSLNPEQVMIPLTGPKGYQDPGSLTVRVLVANIPQVMLSIVYYCYNALLTSIMIAREWVSYATTRKGLRTRQCSGQQRSTHFLTLPYRFSIPIMAGFAILHWLLSLSIFVMQVQLYSREHSPDGNLNGISWSSISILLEAISGAIMLIVLLMAGFQPWPKTVPMVSSNSLAISHYCRPVVEGQESIKKLQLGIVVVNGDSVYTFSSEDVRPLIYPQETALQKWWHKRRKRWHVGWPTTWKAQRPS